MNLTRAILWLALFCPALGLVVLIAHSTRAFAAGGFVANFQSLIAGGLAILAALITVRPVWRQLERMAVQTNTAYREFLRDRLRATARRQKWLSEHLKPLDDAISSRLYEAQEFEDGAIRPGWAFDAEQRSWQPRADLDRYMARTLESPEIEEALTTTRSALQRLGDTLEAIHRPHSLDQVGEDYSISDEEWEALKVAGRRAEFDLPSIAYGYTKALKNLDAAFEEELSSLRRRLKQVEEALLRARV